MTTKLNKIRKKATTARLGFAYHNHEFEFEYHDGEKSQWSTDRQDDVSV